MSGCSTSESTSTSADPKLPAEIWVLVGAAFVIAVGYGLVAPVLPQFARGFGVGFTAASAIISAFALMRLLFAPFSGVLVQRLGERWVYLSGLGIVAVSTGLCAFSQTYWQLLVLRSLGGIGSTMFTVSSLALVIRLSPFHQRGRVSGLWSSSFLIGSVSGPLVGGALAGLGLRVPFLIYATALLVACAIVYISLRNSQLAAPETGHRAPELTFRQGLAEPAYPAMLWSNFANGAAVFGVRMAFVPLIVVETLDESPGMAGVALTAFAVGNVLVLFQAGRLSDRFGRRPFLIAGALVCGVGTAGLGFAPDLLWLLAASVVAGIGSGMLTPTQQAALADVVGAKARSGPVLAGFQMAGDLGAVIGPVVAGILVEHFGFAIGLSATGSLLLVAAVVWLLVPETLRRTDEHIHTGEPAGVPTDDDEYQLAHRAAVEHMPEDSTSRRRRGLRPH
ncbi:MFS transporter [Nocardia higoensis]|uniref:MFS transporter n=1 Tax=Nocardia higoensis TaxID=228599 RepID=UPI0003112973|nr:MFS transporter [Nocardia higoensis]